MQNLKRTLSLFLAAVMLASFVEPLAVVYASEPVEQPTEITEPVQQEEAQPIQAEISEPGDLDMGTQADEPAETPNAEPPAAAKHLSGTMIVSADDILASYADLYKNGDVLTTAVTISAKIRCDNGDITQWTQKYKTDAPKASINASVGYDDDAAVEQRAKSAGIKQDFTFLNIKETANVSFSKESLGLNQVVRRIKNVTVPVTLEVEANGETVVLQETATFNIIFTNEPPVAEYDLVTNEMADTDPDGKYFYIGKMVTLTDKAADPEDDLASSEIQIKQNGAAIAVIQNGQWKLKEDTPDSPIVNAKETGNNTYTFFFAKAGTYNIEQEVTDSWGETERSSRTIKVSEKPEAPVGKINASSDYALENETIKISDGSTDINGDIVKWEWDEILVQKDDGTTASATGLVTGTLTDKTPESAADVVPGGELTFTKKGTYVLGLTVTDILGMSNKVTKTIQIIDNVPILNLTASNGYVNGKPVYGSLTKPAWTNAFNESDSFDPHFSAAADLPAGTPTVNGVEYLVIKQNRAVYLDTAASFGKNIRDKDTQWVFKDADGYTGYVEQNVSLEERASNDRHKLFVAKEPGCFLLSVTLHNDYSDELAQSSPNDASLAARTKNVLVVVIPDVEPEVVLSVVNDEVPSFDENPSSITIHVSASAKSIDNDILTKYEWKVFKDTNGDGDFTNDGTYWQRTGTGLAEVDIPIRFATGANGKYQVQLTVTESMGQPTITKLIPKNFAKTASATTEFTVDWAPTITFQMPEFAYVDDTVKAVVKAKDEKLADCTIDWEIWRSIDEVNFEKINPATLPVCSLTSSNIELRVTNPGYYLLKATITDADGHSNSHTANTIRIYDLPQAIITDGEQYRWQDQEWTYKEARKFTLSGMNSQADDVTGEALHEIDHDKDVWSITPLEGQKSENILVEDLDGTPVESLDNFYFKMSHKEFNQQLAILAPGKYQVEYIVTNTYGKKSIPATQIITISKDTSPVISVEKNVSTPSYNSSLNITSFSITLDIDISSSDYDLIKKEFYTISYAYDSNNDTDFDDEQWKTVISNNIQVLSSTPYQTTLRIVLTETNLGNYKFSVWAKDIWNQETLNSVPDSARKNTTEEIFITAENDAPNGTFDIRHVLYGDVLFVGSESEVADNIEAIGDSYGNRFGSEAGGTKLDVTSSFVEGTTESVLNGVFTVKVTWPGDPSNSGKPDPDSHVYFYDRNGTMIDHLSYSKKAACGCTLDQDDRNGCHGGERLTFDFDNIPDNVATFKIKMHGFLMDSPVMTTVKLEKIMPDGTIEVPFIVNELVHYGQYNDFGTFIKNEKGQWDFVDRNGRLLTQSETVINGTPLDEILSNSTWRSNTEKFVIYADDKIRDMLNPGGDPEDPNSYSRIISLVESQNIHLIILCSSENWYTMNRLANTLSVKSIAIRTGRTNFSSAMNQATTFIRSILLKNQNKSWWVLSGYDLTYTKYYSDKNNDPQWYYEPTSKNAFLQNPSFLAQYFWYKHNPYYFDNTTDYATFNETRLNKEISKFTNVGVYETNYKIKDNPVPDKVDNSPNNTFDSLRKWSNDYGNDVVINGRITNPYQKIYVHRKPIADFSISASMQGNRIQSIRISSNAYDLDHNISDRQKKGLEQYKWGYLTEGGYWVFKEFLDEATGVQWINNMVSNATASWINGSGSRRNILVSYAVRDYDGENLIESIPITTGSTNNWSTSNRSVTHKNGVWSDPEVKWVTFSTDVNPIALFSTDKASYDLGEHPILTDKSYSPAFYNIVRWNWEICDKKETRSTSFTTGAGQISTAQQRIFSFIDNQRLGYTDEDNTYIIKLVVVDSKGNESTQYSVQILISPTNTQPIVTGNTNSIFKSSNPTIYEWDPWDENVPNAYFGNQLRGKEILDWSLSVTDPDNNDKYGSANDTSRVKVQFMMERFVSSTRRGLAPSASAIKAVTFPSKTVSLQNVTRTSSIEPFSIFKNNTNKLTWGLYRITAFVTDLPNNNMQTSTAQLTTTNHTIALDLYVIPKLFLDDAQHKLELFFNGEPYDLSVEVIPGESLEITAETGAQSTGTRIIYPDGLGGTLVQEMTPVKVTKDIIKWQATWTLPEDVEEDDLDANMLYYFKIETYTDYGNQSGEETRTKSSQQKIKVLPIKLYDYNITGVTDPSVTFTDPPSGDTNPPIFVRNMAMDLNNAESLMKLSYAFEFEITSKGMKKDNDHVVLEPVFYGWDGTAYTDELDMYYLNNDQYVKLGDSNDNFGIYTSAEDDSLYLGSLSQLTLPIECRTFIDRSTQKWTGRYGLPGSAVFVKKGTTLNEDNLYHTDEFGHGVLIAFNIYATKDGTPKYNYVAKNQWAKEFFQNEGTGAIINPQKQLYNQPWVVDTCHIPTIVVNSDANALSNYETRPVWTK